MELLLQTCRVVSMVAFLGYGAACLVPGVMNAEFERYGLPRLRVLTGSLEVAGALGLMAGHRFPTLGAAAAGGLALLMICGLLARLRIRDPFTAMLPATVLMLLNGLLALAWFQRTESNTLSMISSKPVPHTAVSLPLNQVCDYVPTWLSTWPGSVRRWTSFPSVAPSNGPRRAELSTLRNSAWSATHHR